MPGEAGGYLYTAISRIAIGQTRFVFAKVMKGATAYDAADFLDDLGEIAPGKISSVKTTNHEAFTHPVGRSWEPKFPDRMHPFRKACRASNIGHLVRGRSVGTGLKEKRTGLARPPPGNSGDWKIAIGDRARKTAATDPVPSVSNLRARKGPRNTGLCAACGDVRRFTKGGFEPPDGGIKKLAQSGVLWVDIYVSSLRVLEGTLAAAPIAVVLGMLVGRLRWMEDTIEPVVELLRPVPPLALLPMIILWFGIGEASKVFFIAYSCFRAYPVNAHTHYM